MKIDKINFPIVQNAKLFLKACQYLRYSCSKYFSFMLRNLMFNLQLLPMLHSQEITAFCLLFSSVHYFVKMKLKIWYPQEKSVHHGKPGKQIKEKSDHYYYFAYYMVLQIILSFQLLLSHLYCWLAMRLLSNITWILPLSPRLLSACCNAHPSYPLCE